MADTKKNALAELAEQLKNYHSQSPIINKAQRIVEELAKVRMTSPMLRFNRPAADESVKAVDRCLEIAEEGVKDGK